MLDVQTFLNESAKQHRDHLCPRQVLGVRMGMYAGELLGLDLPQVDKRLFAFVETDGCLVDGISAATQCSLGHRTMHLLDYGKTAATFVDTSTHRAIRILPAPGSRTRALEYSLDAPDRWHAQLNAYQIMPTEELLHVQPVELTISLESIISRHGLRVVCEICGEDIINEREIKRNNQILCRSCGGDSYYEPILSAEFFAETSTMPKTAEMNLSRVALMTE
jgi:formylmethanofuran dehydrogenase subunit E